jgi:PAS domain S-box-containing protein
VKLHIKKKIVLGFISALLVLMVLGVFSYYNIEKLIRAFEKRLWTTTVINTCEQIMKDVVDMETAQRGFVITGDTAFLAPYRQARQPVFGLLEDLQGQLASQPEASTIPTLDRLLTQRVHHIEEVISARYEGELAAQQKIKLGQGKILTDSLRYHIDTIQKTFNNRLDEQHQVVAGQLEFMQGAFLGLAGSVTCILGILFYRINIQLQRRMEAEEKLQQTIHEVKELYDQAPCGYLSVDQTIHLCRVNQTLLGWMGYTSDEVLGNMKFEDLLTPASKEKFLASFQRDFEIYKDRGGVFGLEFDFQRKDGSSFPVLVNSVATFDDEGNFIQSRTTVFDNTDRVKSEARFRTVLESSPDAMVIVDAEGLIQLVNQEGEQLFGYTRNELVGKPVEVLVPGELRPEHVIKRTLFFNEPSRRPMGKGLHLKALHASGKSIPVEISLSPLALGEERSVIAAIRDVTEARHAQDKILKLNKELESFTYSVSHDLRAPLRSINGYTEILKEDYAHLFDAEGLNTLDVIIRNAKKMGALIDDLLQFSRMGRSEIMQERVEMDALVLNVIEELNPRSKPQPVAWTIHPLPTATGDKSMLQQVWQNLIGNAVKYASKAEAPKIEIGGERHAGWVTYWVRDNGVGFDMKYADKLFGVFQRLHKMNEFEGTGVGLALVHRIVDRHLGKVWAEAALNKGATFYFKLPIT